MFIPVIGNVVWLDEVTATRALINMSSLPDQEKTKSRENNEEKTAEKTKKGRLRYAYIVITWLNQQSFELVLGYCII